MAFSGAPHMRIGFVLLGYVVVSVPAVVVTARTYAPHQTERWTEWSSCQLIRRADDRLMTPEDPCHFIGRR